MTLREFYLARRRAEVPIFLSVLKALPADRLGYQPHDRSPSAEQIVWTLTSELGACVDAATHFRAEWKADPPPPLREMVDLFERRSNDLTDLVSRMDETSWNRVAQFSYNGKVVSEQPIGQFLWFILFDAIHHRGQLSAYLRPMGGSVPAIYGPSADSRSM
ncbi:MAG TPA: DinB family protein [Vicinamibacterales bacterium]|nr:DinB family protein [Vicinamibacterales bacterium]